MKGFISFLYGLLPAFTAILKRHVMVIYLFFGLFWVGAVIAQPSVVESSAFIPRQEIPELGNGNLQIGESGFEESVLVLRPVSNDGVERTKFGKDGRTEFSGSGVKFVEPSVEIEKPRAKTSQQDRAKDGVPMGGDEYENVWYWVIYIIALTFIFNGIGYKHQQKLLNAQRSN